MRLGSLTLSATLSAALLSGCSFIGGQQGQTKNPYASQQAGQYGSVATNQHCQIPTPRHPIPRGCRPEQVTIGVPAQRQPSFASNGFPQQPQFGQPQYTSGGYGAALGQSAPIYQTGPRKRKPKLRGSLSLGAERSISGDLLDPFVTGPAANYDPQLFSLGSESGTAASGLVTETTFTANDSIETLDRDDLSGSIRRPGLFESSDAPAVSFKDVWAAPLSIKGGLEYIVNDRTTVFVNGGYTYSAGEERDVASIDATVYQEISNQPFAPDLSENGPPEVNVTFIPNQRIASFAYEFSDLRQYDLEVGARRYLNPIVKSDGYKTVTPFVGASVGVSYVNDVDFTVSQTQTSFQSVFDGDPTTFDVPNDGTSTRLYDSDWLPQGQLNVGAEWQVTPGFALAAETGLKFQGARDFADFENADGEIIEGGSGDVNISIPLTLRGSVNF